MEGQFFNPEQFEELLGLLQAVSTDQGARNEQMRQAHNAAFQEFGPEVAARVPDVAETAHPELVGKALVAFLQTIPGVRTNATTLETVSNPNSVAMSEQAISAFLRRGDKKAEIGMSLTFASPLEANPRHTLEFERVDPKGKRVAVSVEIGLDRVPKRGVIKIGSKDGQFVNTQGSVTFGQDSRLISGDARMKLQAGEQLNIIPLLTAITNPDGLEETFEPAEFIQVAKVPLLPV